jgi:serine/threonine protein kinase
MKRKHDESWLVLRPLMGGGNSVVYECIASDRPSKQQPFLRNPSAGPVVVKVSRTDPSYMEEEDRKLERFAHPNIVESLGLVTATDPEYRDPIPGLMLPRAEHTLEGLRMQGERIATLSLLRVARQITAGLGHMHLLGYIHGDVTTANVLMFAGTAKLCDLDFCAVQFTSQPCMQLGTPYASRPPEVVDCLWGAERSLRGEQCTAEDDRIAAAAHRVVAAHPDTSLRWAILYPAHAAGDVWSVGTLLFMMSTRVRNFVGPVPREAKDWSSFEIDHEHRALRTADVDRHRLLQKIEDPGLRNVLDQCLKLDPAARGTLTQVRRMLHTLDTD